MDANSNTNAGHVLLKDEVYRVVGAAIEVLNSLRIARAQVGVILNFKHAKLEWERLVLSDHSR